MTDESRTFSQAFEGPAVPREIMAIGDWTNNAQLIRDAANLGYIEGRVLDLTFGRGLFWAKIFLLDYMTELVTNDLNSELAKHHEDFRKTKWGPSEFDTVVFDPPYKLAGKRAGDDIDQRYGIETYTSRADVSALIAEGCREAARLSSRWVLVKCMDQVNGGKVRWQTDDVTTVLCDAGFEKRDAFFLKRWRPQPVGRKQNTARRNYSTLIVFERARQMPTTLNVRECICTTDGCDEEANPDGCTYCKQLDAELPCPAEQRLAHD